MIGNALELIMLLLTFALLSVPCSRKNFKSFLC